ncbi:hypothetical protein TNCV_5064741 [Trichonephila clavipes]|nr:hypothetical protein TNCV_5064741 [Trichonephila clavipes]
MKENLCLKNSFLKGSGPQVEYRWLKQSGPTPNLVDVHDTLMEYNAKPSLWEAISEQDLMFDDYVQVDTDIAV